MAAAVMRLSGTDTYSQKSAVSDPAAGLSLVISLRVLKTRELQMVRHQQLIQHILTPSQSH
jgi:hypothetical protein